MIGRRHQERDAGIAQRADDCGSGARVGSRSAQKMSETSRFRPVGVLYGRVILNLMKRFGAADIATLSWAWRNVAVF